MSNEDLSFNLVWTVLNRLGSITEDDIRAIPFLDSKSADRVILRIKSDPNVVVEQKLKSRTPYLEWNKVIKLRSTK